MLWIVISHSQTPIAVRRVSRIVSLRERSELLLGLAKLPELSTPFLVLFHYSVQWGGRSVYMLIRLTSRRMLNVFIVFHFIRVLNHGDMHRRLDPLFCHRSLYLCVSVWNNRDFNQLYRALTDPRPHGNFILTLGASDTDSDLHR